MLTLKRASKSRPNGQWSADDYDAFDGDRTLAVSCGRTRHRQIGNGFGRSRRACRNIRMIEATQPREDAMEAFKVAWSPLDAHR
jgi:hypothetical protein